MTTLDRSSPSSSQVGTTASTGRLARAGQRLAWLEPVWLTLLAPAILLPGRFWDVHLQPYFVVALFLFWPVRRLAYGRWTVPSPLTWPTLVLLAWTPVTIAVAMDRARAWEAAGYVRGGGGVCAMHSVALPAHPRSAAMDWVNCLEAITSVSCLAVPFWLRRSSSPCAAGCRPGKALAAC